MRGMSSRTTRTRARAMIFLFYNLPVASSRFGLICVCPFSSSSRPTSSGLPSSPGVWLRCVASRGAELPALPGVRCAPLSVEYAVPLGNSDGDVVVPHPRAAVVVVVANSCDAKRAGYGGYCGTFCNYTCSGGCSESRRSKGELLLDFLPHSV